MSIVVVGAGLAGLAAAQELCKAGADVQVWDIDHRPGGVIQTDVPAAGWIVEGGPDGFLGADPEIPELAAQLGVADRIIRQDATGSLAWDGRSLTRLSSGAAAGLLDIDTRGLDLSAGFASFAGGMAELVNALAAATPPRQAGVTALAPTSRGWRVSGAGGLSFDATGLILALPAYAAARLIAPFEADSSRVLEAIPYHRSANVSLAYRRDQVAHALDCAGFAAMPSDTGMVRACTFASSKFPGRAPRDHVLLRAFVADSGHDLGSRTHGALAPILGISGTPLWTREFVWPRGIPRYDAGHGERVADARRQLAQVGPIALAGAGYDGAGVSACVRSGRNAAGELLQR